MPARALLLSARLYNTYIDNTEELDMTKAQLIEKAKLHLQLAQDLIAAALGDTDARWDTEYAIDDVIADLNADLGILEK